MSILIKTVRVNGFRGLQNLEVDLEPITVLTGMNNTGKTSLLKAIQIVLGSRQFISKEDFYTADGKISDKIIIDIKIVPFENDKITNQFDRKWEVLFTESRIKIDSEGNAFVPLRIIVFYDNLSSTYTTLQYILSDWPPLIQNDECWFQSENGNETRFYFDKIQFYYMDAQRDIIEDIKARKSYLGKMMSQIDYSADNIIKFERIIEDLNKQLIDGSPILSEIKKSLENLNTTINSTEKGIVEITPLTKKIQDLNKGLSIYYGEKKDSFPLEYHGMGTRSWSSLLILKSFIELLYKTNSEKKLPFYSIVTIEEPEAHLHPNAQKQLFHQIGSMYGQKVISTHSPFVAATAELQQIRSLYKDNRTIKCGVIDITLLSKEDLRKIKREVIASKGEIFFSKAIVFCEGETEEQALPILASKHFGKTPVEFGINFIAVKGYGYLPFLRVAVGLKIPFLIFSDAENSVKANVKKTFSKCGSEKSEDEVIVFLDDGNNFEMQLITDGFSDEIKKAIFDREIPQCKSQDDIAAKKKEILGIDLNEYFQRNKCPKTQLAPAIADAIVESGRSLPPKVLALFGKIKYLLRGGTDGN